MKASIGNIIVGKPTVNHTGTFRVENKGTGLAAVMELVKPPMLTMSSKKRSLHEVPPCLTGDWLLFRFVARVPM